MGWGTWLIKLIIGCIPNISARLQVLNQRDPLGIHLMPRLIVQTPASPLPNHCRLMFLVIHLNHQFAVLKYICLIFQVKGNQYFGRGNKAGFPYFPLNAAWSDEWNLNETYHHASKQARQVQLQHASQSESFNILSHITKLKTIPIKQLESLMAPWLKKIWTLDDWSNQSLLGGRMLAFPIVLEQPQVADVIMARHKS